VAWYIGISVDIPGFSVWKFLRKAAAMDPIIQVKNITKEFFGVKVLNNVSFDIHEGEVAVLVGENGAGKSTLMKILSGVYVPTSGSISLFGKEYLKFTPRQSKECGISIIYQELSVIDSLTIAENLFVGNIPTRKVCGLPVIDSKVMTAKANEMLKLVGLQHAAGTYVEELSISEKQLVEISKAISKDCKVLIMDEPTSSLTLTEANNLIKIITGLKRHGIAIIYISHKLDEISKVGDIVHVLKDGSYVGNKRVAEIRDKSEIVSMMVGREISDSYQNTESEHKDILFRVENITRKDRKVENINFELYKNEILGFAGLIGSGRTELMEAVFGAAKCTEGKIYKNGIQLKTRDTYDSIKRGIALITESRRDTGIFPNFEIWKNIEQAALIKKSKFKGILGLTDSKQGRRLADKAVKELGIKCASIDQDISELSGGNQQKVIIAKWFASEADIYIFDEPTRGIDIGAKNEVYKIMRRLADQGKGVIMVSSELPELLMVSDRIIVFNNGKIKGVINHKDATEERIMSYAI
jgi:D-allose transport system ATP-binding protein